MRLHRFYIKDKINPKEKVVLRYFDHDPILSQWKKVFRYLAGSRVVLFDGSGNDYLSIIEKMDNGEAVLRILETNKTIPDEVVEKKGKKGGKNSASEKKIGGNSKMDGKTVHSVKEAVVEDNKLKVNVTILMSLIKNDNFDMVLQKATELGVSEIVPIITERTIKKDLNMVRSERILIEASEQCGRSDIPVITPVKKLSEALSELTSSLTSSKNKGIGAYVCNMDGLNIDVVLKKQNSYTDLVFLIGPEGGWSPKELKMFEDAKIKSVKISQNVLRAETAVIALLAVVLR